MKLSVLQENLSRSLSIVSRMVASRAQLPVLANILLSTDKGKLKLSATNLETGINFWIGAKIEEEGAVSIPARILTEFIASLPADKLELKTKENSLEVISGAYRADFVGLPAGEFPAVPTKPEKPSVEFEAKLLIQAISQVAFAAAQDETRPVLTGVFLGIKGEDLVMVATDGYRLSLRKLLKAKEIEEIKEFKKGIIIPASTLTEILRIVSDKEEEKVGLTFSSEANQVIFSSASAEIISRLIEGQFPDFEKIIPEKGQTKVTVEREGLLRAAKLAAIFARESANVILTEITKSGLKLSANTTQVGSNVSQVEAKVEGEEAKVAFNSRYLLDFLNSTGEESINFETGGALSPGVFAPSGDSSYLHIIMPVRVQE